jgi:hypothetical protein
MEINNKSTQIGVNRFKPKTGPLRGRTFKRLDAFSKRKREEDIERWNELFKRNVWKSQDMILVPINKLHEIAKCKK